MKNKFVINEGQPVLNPGSWCPELLHNDSDMRMTGMKEGDAAVTIGSQLYGGQVYTDRARADSHDLWPEWN